MTTPPLTGSKPVYTFGVGTPSGTTAAAAKAADTGTKTYTMTSTMGSVATDNGLPKFATGGIVTSPTIALIGEAGENEAVLPLSKLDAMLSGTVSNNTVAMTVTYAPVINVPDGDPDKLRDVMDDEFEKFKRFMQQYEHENDRVRL